MADKTEPEATGRREFLKLAGLGTVAGGAALIMQDRPAEAAGTVAEDGNGYRETPHVKAFYESARF